MSIPLDYVLISWITNCPYSRGLLICLLYQESSSKTLPWQFYNTICENYKSTLKISCHDILHFPNEPGNYEYNLRELLWRSWRSTQMTRGLKARHQIQHGGNPEHMMIYNMHVVGHYIATAFAIFREG